MSFESPSDPYAAWDDFFRMFVENNKLKYRIAISDAYAKSETWIYVLFEDLQSHDPGFANYIQCYPEQALVYGLDCFKEIYRSENPQSFNDSYEYEVRIKTENNHLEIPLRNIKANHVERLIYTKGIILRHSPPKPQIIIAQFECPVCQARQSIRQHIDTEELTEPTICSNPNCTNKKSFNLLMDFSSFMNYQKASIQETHDDLAPGEIPRNITLIFTKNLIDSVRPGERVKIMAIYKSRPAEKARGKKSSVFIPYLKVISVEGIKTDEDESDLSPEDILEINRIRALPNVREVLARSIAPLIFGQDHLKMAALLSIVSGVERKKDNGSKLRGDIHVLFLGDPGTGKSQILQFCSKMNQRSIYTSGKGASAAGLTAAVIRDGESSSYSLEAGALVLASGATACIDELEKMEKADRSAIHQAMEQQSISISKAGINATLPAKTSIIAAANPKSGRYDEFKTPIDNINLSPPIISRFDLIFIVIDKPDIDNDENIADFIISSHQSEHAVNINASTHIPVDMLKKYIKHAKATCRPTLNKEAGDKIKIYYQKIRQLSQRDKGNVSIMPRYLEAMIRIAEAAAKIELSDVATIDHADFSINLMDRSLKEVGLDPETGLIDMDRLVSERSNSQKQKIIKILALITSMQKQRANRPIKLVDLYATIKEEKICDEQFAIKAIEVLIDQSEIYSPHTDEIKLMKELDLTDNS